MGVSAADHAVVVLFLVAALVIHSSDLGLAETNPGNLGWVDVGEVVF